MLGDEGALRAVRVGPLCCFLLIELLVNPGEVFFCHCKGEWFKDGGVSHRCIDFVDEELTRLIVGVLLWETVDYAEEVSE